MGSLRKHRRRAQLLRRVSDGRLWLMRLRAGAFVALLIATVACSPARSTPPPATVGPLFEPGMVVVTLADGAGISVLAPEATEVTPETTQTITAADLRRLGVRVLPPHAVAAELLSGVQVLWIHRSALQDVSAADVQLLLAQGVAVGMLDGSADEFQQVFGQSVRLAQPDGPVDAGVQIDNPNLLHVGGNRPVFVLVQTLRCAHGPTGIGTRVQSDWLTLSAFTAESRSAVDFQCLSSPDIVPPD
jgi:hypothetical protein